MLFAACNLEQTEDQNLDFIFFRLVEIYTV